MLSLVEAPLLQYLPWRISPFANVAGFPNLFLLRFALAVKSAQNVIVLYCQFAVLAEINSSSSLTQVARTFLYINVALTLTIALLGMLEGFLKRSLLAGTQLSIEPSGNRDNSSRNNNGDVDIGAHQSNTVEAGLELRDSIINPLGIKNTAGAAAAGAAAAAAAAAAGGGKGASQIRLPVAAGKSTVATGEERVVGDNSIRDTIPARDSTSRYGSSGHVQSNDV